MQRQRKMNYTKLLNAEKLIDGIDKTHDLKKVIGDTTAVNLSPSNVGKLLSVGDEYCEFVSVASEYGNSLPEKLGHKFKIHNYIAHNSFFF